MNKNKFLQYISQRIKRDDYRGFHLSQHNRLPFDKVLIILKTINEIAGNQKFKIHIGDWHKQKQEGCETYYKIVDTLNKKIGQCTVNSLKKNIFPDLQRMGLLNRYNNKNQLIDKNKKESVSKVELNWLALKFIAERKPRIQYKIYVETTEKLLEPILDGLFYVLYKEFETINIYEYMLIFSDANINTSKKIELIKSFRILRRTDIIKTLKEIKNIFVKLNKEAEDKIKKRDFLNWYNEALQTFVLLNQTVYFKTFRKTFLMLSISQEALELTRKRSQKQRAKYFIWHKVKGKEGHQAHHICPINYARTKNELEFLDNYKNLIYISDSTHLKIPHDNNLYIKIFLKDDRLFLLDITNPTNKIEITNDVILNPKNIKKMIEYNQKIIDTIIT